MNKQFTIFSLAFLFFGFIAVIVSFYVLVADSFEFWSSGIAKQARVISLDHVDIHLKGSKTYYYEIEIDGRYSVHSFPFELTESHYYDVLSIDNGKKVVLGNEDSNLIDLISSQLGGFTTYILIALIIYMMFKLIRYVKGYLMRSRNPYD